MTPGLKYLWSAVLLSCYFYAFGVYAQQVIPPQANQGLGNQGLGNQGFFGPGLGLGQGGQGGAANADFDSLIDLIVSTVEYDSWMENGSGEGEIQPFPTGVYADPHGTLRFDKARLASADFSRRPSVSEPGKPADARQSSELRYVSLPRLERAIADHQVARKPLPVEMLTLAGLQRIDYVLINPATQDLIVAGPAGDWQLDADGVLVGIDTGRPVMRLDDLLTVWRRPSGTAFGCSIVPRQQALAATQDYLQRSAAQPLEPSDRKAWLTGLRDTLGTQDVEYFGMIPESHVAMVLLVADYHMKLIGMGLADAVPGVRDYLATVEMRPDGSAPAMAVLRWWFAMTERPVKTNAARDVFELPAGGVQVLSENEFLAARGQRVHTNQSDPLNSQFAQSFTAAFADIAARYPLYGELQNVFDLALLISLIDRENLLERSGWQPTLFEDAARLPMPRLRVPREVETVVNHRVLNRRHIIAGVSGGVWIDAPRSLDVGESAEITDVRSASPGRVDLWWWDEASRD